MPIDTEIAAYYTLKLKTTAKLKDKRTLIAMIRDQYPINCLPSLVLITSTCTSQVYKCLIYIQFSCFQWVCNFYKFYKVSFLNVEIKEQCMFPFFLNFLDNIWAIIGFVKVTLSFSYTYLQGQKTRHCTHRPHSGPTWTK